MMREVSLETLPNIIIRDPSRHKNLPIMSKCIQINKRPAWRFHIGDCA